MKCSICGNEIDKQLISPPGEKEVYFTKGHNAQPINNGRCCTLCNDIRVTPTRLLAMVEKRDKEKKAMKNE